MEDISESQPYIKGNRRGLDAEFGLVNGIKGIPDAGIKRDTIVFGEAIAELSPKQTAEVHSPVRRVLTSGLRTARQLVAVGFYRVLQKQICRHTSVHLYAKGFVDQKVSCLHGDAEVTHAVVDGIGRRVHNRLIDVSFVSAHQRVGMRRHKTR